MKRLAAIAALSALVASVSPTTAATITEEDVRIAFLSDCSGSGFYHEWNRTIHPTLREALDDHPLLPVEWGPDAAIAFAGGSAAVPGQDYLFRLIGPDQTTVLFEAPFAVVTPTREAARFSIDVTLDCSTVPYTVVPMPDTSLAAPDRRRPTPILLGMVLLLSAGGSALVRMRPIGPHRH